LNLSRRKQWIWTTVRQGPIPQPYRYLKAPSSYLPKGAFAILLHLQLAATYSITGREKEARTEAAEVLRINPKFSLERYAQTLYFKNQADINRTLDALRKAGLK
jgi:hypothetical protein